MHSHSIGEPPADLARSVLAEKREQGIGVVVQERRDCARGLEEPTLPAPMEFCVQPLPGAVNFPKGPCALLNGTPIAFFSPVGDQEPTSFERLIVSGERVRAGPATLRRLELEALFELLVRSDRDETLLLLQTLVEEHRAALAPLPSGNAQKECAAQIVSAVRERMKQGVFGGETTKIKRTYRWVRAQLNLPREEERVTRG